MYEEYKKEKIIKNKTEDEKNSELILSILKTKTELDTATKNFEYAHDELIDYYSYQIKANQSKLDYLLKKAKKRQLALDMVNSIEYRLYQENRVV